MWKKSDQLCLSMLRFPSLNIKKEGEYTCTVYTVDTCVKKILSRPLHKVSTLLRVLFNILYVLL